MKNKKANIIFLAMTVISALVAVALVYGYIHKKVTTAEQELAAKYTNLTNQSNLVDVIVCATDIPAGTLISDNDIKIQKISNESIGQAHIISDPQQVIGQKIQQNMYVGEWIVNERLHPILPQTDNKIRLATGMRAIRLWLDATSGLLGIIEAEDMVDVLAVLPEKNNQQRIGKIVLQNIKIISVGNRISYEQNAPASREVDNKKRNNSSQTKNGAPKATTVTLEVTPQQALDLTLAMEIGKLHLALRNSEDQEIVISSPGLKQATLLRKGKKAAHKKIFRKKKATKKETVTIISGDSVNTEVLDQ